MLEQVRSGFAELNGTTLYYEVTGQGHPLVLNHGWLGDYHFWDDQFEAFARHFKVIRYDIRGFGQSGKRQKGMEPFSMERDLRSLLEFLGIEKTFLLGLSMGGTLAIDFTLQYPEMVDALITVSAGISGFEDVPDEQLKARFGGVQKALGSGDIAGAAEILLQIWTDGLYRKPEQVDSRVRERVRASMLHNFKRGDDPTVQPQKMEPPAAGRLSEIHAPTLILVGNRDVKNIQLIAQTLENEIAGARKVVISDTAHYPNLEKPQQFNEAVIAFLKDLL